MSIKSAPSTPHKRGTTPRKPKSGGNARSSALPDEWSFLNMINTTPTKSSRRGSPLSQLRDENWLISESPHQGRTSQSFVVENDDEEEELFVKKMLIMSPDDEHDKAYREQKILKEFRRLFEKGKCFNFVNMVMSGTSEESNYMEIVMEKGGGTLFRRKEMEIEELREVVFQVLFALYIAQKEFRFVHYDMHDKNILVETMEQGTCNQITTHNSTFYFSRVLVKIADFALSRIETEECMIYNTKNAIKGGFDPAHDLNHFADYLSKINITDKMKKVEEMKQLKNLKFQMKNSEANPERLLNHPFFNKLQKKPSNCTIVLKAKDDEKKPTKKILSEPRSSPRSSPRKKKQVNIY